MYTSQEQFFAEEFSRIYQRQKREKQRRDLKLKERIKRELAILQEEENQKKFWWKVAFLRKLHKAKNKTAVNFKKNSESDNLANQVVLSNVEYIAPAAAAAGAIGRGIVGSGARAAAGAGRRLAGSGTSVATEAGEPVSSGNLGQAMNRLDEMQRLTSPEELDDEDGEEESEETPQIAEDFDKIQSARRVAEAARTAEEKKLQHERALARMQKLAQQVKRIKTALHAAKIGSAVLGAASLGITILVTILIWVGQFIGHYILAIKLIPGFDWLDYLLMAVVVMMIALIVLPIVVFMSSLCRLDIVGLVC